MFTKFETNQNKIKQGGGRPGGLLHGEETMGGAENPGNYRPWKSGLLNLKRWMCSKQKRIREGIRRVLEGRTVERGEVGMFSDDLVGY